MPTETIKPAAAADAAVIAALLRDAGLPHEDFAPHLAHFLVARGADGAVVGAIGAEVCGREALLRSLVVAPAWRGQGLGGRLLAALEQAATAWGVERWWLLTMTAEEFFAARGFRAVSRAEAPPAIAATGEFAGLCPSVASCWTRERRAP
jgi:amino-acid N-acetyltransferase